MSFFFLLCLFVRKTDYCAMVMEGTQRSELEFAAIPQNDGLEICQNVTELGPPNELRADIFLDD